MRIAYVANIRLPTEKAHGLQIMEMCRAFARNGHQVRLIVPQRKKYTTASPWEFYGMMPEFEIVEVPIFDFIPLDRWFGRGALWLNILQFAVSAKRAVRAFKPEVVYSRDPWFVQLAPPGSKCVYEAHDFPKTVTPFHRRLWKRFSRIVTVTSGLKRAFTDEGVLDEKLVVAHDAADPAAFAVAASRAEARRALGLPTEGFIAIYTGHLYPYKGADDLLEACKHLRPASHVVFVGGQPDDLERLKARAVELGISNAIFVGQVPHARIPSYLRAADAAVLPTRAADRHASEFLSPLKLFEYLAAGKAIVATGLPSVREVLDARTAVFVPPQEPAALAAALNALADVPAEVARLSGAAEAGAVEHTWPRRATRVLVGLPEPRPILTWYRRHRTEVLCALLAFLLRAAYVLVFTQHLQGGDGEVYIGYADQLRGIPVWNANMFAFFQPGYPLFLAFVRGLFGTSLKAIGLAQAVISSATVGLVAAMAKRLIGPRAALFAGLMTALSASAIIETGQVYTETLYALLLTSAVYALVLAVRSRVVRRAAIVGACFAVAGLVRELALYNAAVLAAVMGVYRRSWRLAVGLLAPIAVVLIVFGAYNRTIEREQAVEHVPILAKGYEAALQDPQSQAFLLRWRMYPLGVWYFFRYPHRLAEISDDISTKKALFSGDAALIAQEAPHIAVKGILTLLHWAILLLAAFGLWRGRLPREAKIVFFVTIAFAAGTITLSGAARLQGFEYLEPLARYRFPVEPLILLLAAAGVDCLERKSS